MTNLLPTWNAENRKYSDDNPAFCTRPWTELFVTVNGLAKPCCVAEYDTSSTYTTIDQYSRSGYLKAMQQQMLSGILPKVCDNCRVLDQKSTQSFRTKSLRVNIDDQLSSTSSFELKRLEVKWSNLCNYKCRSCNWLSSSTISAEENVLFGTTYPKLVELESSSALADIALHLDKLQAISLAGGEPLLQSKTWELLDMLDRAGKHSLEITMSTNGSLTEYKGRSIFDYIQKFENFTFGISIDAIGAQAEYWRDGSNWNTVLRTINSFRSRFPNRALRISTTISWPNAIAALKLFSMFRNDPKVHFWTIPVVTPPYLRLSAPPQEIKDLIRAEYEQFDIAGINFKVPNAIAELVRYIDMPPMRIDEFQNNFSRLRQIDKHRGVDFFEAFPEFRLYQGLLE